MLVSYCCRYCSSQMGRLEGNALDEARLGFDFLTPEEREDIITYDSSGNVTVRLVCDYCREALEANPELTLIASPLQ
ncbi:anti-sigma-F factor Fin [Paenibacillus thermoaerophilus]|jgi:hypothetical protein|uniref:Anti-sigma-F factor Fin n=1 Tax=Paenibacillus thermoaerophilus TaxID=1215385 RepID=A0ABW2VAS0_9BACL|nr:anti-sigma-F factor Fin family protein [Paenibacillus thermoaerophilus]TMV09461.1 anti-sigma-F factor Fin family protein [Paenibacillus thermoaerophilus]